MNPESIALGTFPFAGVFSSQATNSIEDVLATYFDCGGRELDLAPLYGAGSVQTAVGAILAKGAAPYGTRFATKVGYRISPDAPPVLDGSVAGVRESLVESVAQTGIEQFDLVLLHAPDPNIPLAESIEGLVALRAEGLAREIGIANLTEADLDVESIAQLDWIEQRISLLSAARNAPLVDRARAQGLQVRAYQVIERGILTDGYSPDKLRDGDLRRSKPEYAPEAAALITGWRADHLAPIAAALGVSIEAAAIWFLLRPGRADRVQLGFSRPGQVTAAYGFLALDALSPDAAQQLEAELLAAAEQLHGRLREASIELPGITA